MIKSLFPACFLWIIFRTTVLTDSAAAQPQLLEDPLPLTVMEELAYDEPFVLGAQYDAAVPSPENLLGFPLGQRFASPTEIERCLRAWCDTSPRLLLVEYARSHENRPLYYLVISSPENLARRKQIQADLARLADPRGLSDAEAEQLLARLPGVAWFAYSIHGNETSGADAALAVIYHLAAAGNPEVADLLTNLVVIVDPMMNPDGRHRFLQQTLVHGGAMPNVDDQSLQHRGYWPSGRTNHYLFDLNRDWILGIHPETRGRIRGIRQWHPLLVIDAHEMGALNTYLFSPARDPRNPHYPERRYYWGDVFARDQAAAFDRRGWVYYTGEWADDWYAGYSSWAAFRGSLFILYEQARVARDAVRRPEGTLLTYRESVHHQITSTLANLRTLREHAATLLREFLAERRENLSKKGRYANCTFAVLPTGNEARKRAFLDLMELQGIEVFTNERDFEVTDACDQLGRVHSKLTVPAGTLLIPNRQPEARLVAAMLEFDPHIPEATLQKERQEILRHDESRMYDVTAWNITMLYGLEALSLPRDLPREAVPVELTDLAPGLQPGPGKAVALVFDGEDDRSVAAAARLLEHGVQVRVADRAFTFNERAFARGSVLVTVIDNTREYGDLLDLVARTAHELAIPVWPISTGLGEGDLPDLGGQHFRLLAQPRIAVLAHGTTSSNDFGAIWYNLDQRLGIRHSHLNQERLTDVDLRRYNVLVLPDRYPSPSDSTVVASLRDWITAGGTLVAIGQSAAELATPSASFVQARKLLDVLDDLDRYELAIHREWQARIGQTPSLADVWSHVASPELTYPWQGETYPFTGTAAEASLPDTRREDDRRQATRTKELRKRDSWQTLFMPQGVFLAGRTDDQHWLTFGCGEPLPLLYGSAVGRAQVLMAADGVEAPVRMGTFVPREDDRDSDGMAEPEKLGWGPVPSGQMLYLRMSGLLWPEASHRLANSAYVTREKVGQGQVILFASPPAFRGAALGTTRLLANALIYGPGLGTQQPVKP